MTDDEKAAVLEEERITIRAVERSLALLKQATVDLESWTTQTTMRRRGPPGPPPANALMTATALHLDVMALYRVRMWRERFG